MPQKMKVCNTAQYNTFLKQRGHISGLIQEALENWYAHPLDSHQVGAPPTYTDKVFLMLATVRYLFKLSFRGTVGFMEDLLQNVYKLPHVTVPHYSVFCNRLKALNIPIRDHRTDKKGPVEICIDSSGINIYNTGGGHSKENGEKRKHKHHDQVRKLHVALDPETGNVEELIMTTGKKADHASGAQLVETLPETVTCCYADGAYDKKPFRKACAQKNIKQIVPPIKTGVLRKPTKNDPSNVFEDRNAAIRLRRSYASYEEGHEAWKRQEGYGRRAHVEGFFSRFKRQFGFHFASKSEENRAQELRIKTKILNDFTKLGRARYEKVA